AAGGRPPWPRRRWSGTNGRAACPWSRPCPAMTWARCSNVRSAGEGPPAEVTSVTTGRGVGFLTSSSAFCVGAVHEHDPGRCHQDLDDEDEEPEGGEDRGDRATDEGRDDTDHEG